MWYSTCCLINFAFLVCYGYAPPIKWPRVVCSMLGFIAHSQCVRCYVSKTNVYFRAAQFLDNSKNITIASMSRRLKITFIYKPIQKISKIISFTFWRKQWTTSITFMSFEILTHYSINWLQNQKYICWIHLFHSHINHISLEGNLLLMLPTATLWEWTHGKMVVKSKYAYGVDAFGTKIGFNPGHFYKRSLTKLPRRLQ